MSTSNDSEEEEEYTTSYTKLLQRPNYHHLLDNNDIRSKSRNSSLNHYIFSTAEGQNYHNHRNINHTRMYEDYYRGRKQLGVRLIQQRWRKGGYDVTRNDRAEKDKMSTRLNYSDEHGASNSNSISHEGRRQKRSKRRRANSFSSSDDTSLSPNNSNTKVTNKVAQSITSIQPTLLFRRTNSNLYYSNERTYTNIQFLNSSHVVIGVDNYGDLDIVRVPSSSSSFAAGAIGGGGCTTNVSNGGASEEEEDEEKCGGGIGTLQADRLSLCNNNHGGPRYPMDNNFHCELFGYDNGSKFAVGLRSGRVQLFTTEHAAAAAAFSVGNCLNEGGDAPSSLGSANDLWSCLPSTSTITIGPQRRYYKSEKYPLSILLSNNIAQKASVFDAYTTSFLEEISDWDKTHDDTPNHHHLLQGDGCPWAFREGGSLSSTSLIGACVDAENGDCFSLRVIDERLLQQQQSNDGSASSCGAAMMKVVVVDDRNAAASLNCRERVDAVCFSGEYGVVTSHSIAVARNGAASNITATCLKVSLIGMSFSL